MPAPVLAENGSREPLTTWLVGTRSSVPLYADAEGRLMVNPNPVLAPGEPSNDQLAFAALSVELWIDTDDGDDAAVGSEEAPWLTMAAYHRLVGPAYVTGSHRINHRGSAPLAVWYPPAVGNGGTFSYFGEPETIYEGTLTDASPYTSGSPATTGTIEDTGLPADWSDSG